MSRTSKSNKTFTDIKTGIKKNVKPIEALATVKTKKSSQINHWFPKSKSEVKKRKKINPEKEITSEPIDFKVYMKHKLCPFLCEKGTEFDIS